MKLTSIVCALFSLICVVKADAQCIVINEVMVNGPGPNDGQNAPDTEEWIELYNACDVDVDLSCFVITDGDFNLTFPVGSIIPANGYFTIGSINAGFPVDLNWGTCGCAFGTGIGIFTNGNEQFVLTDGTGIIVDAVYWGNGQFPMGATTPGITGCNPVVVDVQAAGTEFGHMNNGGGQGCSIERACDGSDTWIENCTPTPGATNGTAVITSFEGTSLSFCPGHCTDFTDFSVGTVTDWLWTFEGSETFQSTEQNPTNICYFTSGTYDVTLTTTSGCGSSTLTLPDYIEVTAGPEAVVTASGPLDFCQGDSVTFTTNSPGTYQWLLDGTPIDGEISNQYTAISTGTYSLLVSQDSCTSISADFPVIVYTFLTPDMTPSGDLTLCTGETQELVVNGAFDTYQWLLNDLEIPGATDSSYVASEPGVYTVDVTLGTCSGVSNTLTLSYGNIAQVDITPTNNLNICNGEEVVFSAVGIYTTYQWLLDGNPIPGATEAFYTATAEGNYSLVASVGLCFGESEDVFVNVFTPNAPNINPNTTQTICEGGQVTFNLNGNFNNNIQWFLDGSILGGETDNQLVATVAGIYTVQVTGNGCPAVSAGVELIVNPAPDVTVTPSTTQNICEGQTTVLSSASGFASYQWLQDGFNLAGADVSSLTVGASGQYSVLVSNGECSALSNTVTVNVNPYPFAIISPIGDVAPCAEIFNISANTNGAVQWFFNGNPIQGANQPSLAASQDGTYSFVAAISTCTTASGEVNVSFQDAISVDILVSEDSLCEGEEVVLTVSGNYDAVNWSNGGAGNSTIITSGGTYSVDAFKSPCNAQDNVFVFFYDSPEVNAGPDVISDCDYGVALQGSGTGELTWEVSPSLVDFGGGTAQVNPDLSREYILTATNEYCSATDKVFVTADCSNIRVPNVFTPNGDGKNDVFEIKSRGVASYELKIYDRWGMVLFETTQPNDFWNGKRNGDLVPDGTYYWTIIALDQYGKPMLNDQSDSGSLTLLRN